MFDVPYIVDFFLAKGLCSLSCNSWWAMVRHLCWSLLGIPDLSPFDSADHPSVTLARFMYGAFMIMGVILLVNMMIALLSNTYQQVEVRHYSKFMRSCPAVRVLEVVSCRSSPAVRVLEVEPWRSSFGGRALEVEPWSSSPRGRAPEFKPLSFSLGVRALEFEPYRPSP